MPTAPQGCGMGRRIVTGMPLAVALAAMGAMALREANDPDLWWHLATGRYIVAERQVPTADVFSFTAVGHRWVTHEWLADLLLYGGYRLIGLGGLVLLFAAMAAVSFVPVYRRCRARPVIAGLSVLLAAAASAMTWGVRPQVFSLFFASLYLYILETAEGAHTRRIWLLPLLALLWANLHSGFVAGLVIVGVYVVCGELAWLRRRQVGEPLLGACERRLASVWLAMAVASLITPNGLTGVLFPFGTLSNRLIQASIMEWQSPDFHRSYAWPLLAFGLALLGACAVSRQRVDGVRVVLLLGAALATAYSARHVPFLALVGAPVLAEQVEGLFPARSRPVAEPSRAVWVALGLAAAALCAAMGVRIYWLYWPRPGAQGSQYPVSAVSYLQAEGLGGRVFNAYHWGGYLIWQGYQVFIDGRAEVYGDEVFGQYLKAHEVHGDWESPLRDYAVDVVLIPSDSQLAVLLRESEHWREAYRDDVAAVFLPDGVPARG